MRWFKNLKKWQKGALIGCGVGLFACLLMLALMEGPGSVTRIVGEWIVRLHVLLYVTFDLFIRLPSMMSQYAFLGAIVVFYGGLGALTGKVQQMASPAWKWLLTALLALFLLFFYWFNLQLAMVLET